MEKIVSLEKINIFQQNKIIFKDITLSIDQGEFIYIIGETGSGKSSLLKTLYGEIKPASGVGKIFTYDLLKIKKREIPYLRRKIGIVFQDLQLLSDRTIFENLSFVLKSTGWKNNEKIKSRINKVLKDVHLQNIENKLPHTLSGGEQQRAAIARSLLNNPSIIIADEPTGNLDPEKSEKIIELLLEINLNGTTVIIATHDYSILKKFSRKTLKCENLKVNEISL